jgi:hypothetical protein
MMLKLVSDISKTNIGAYNNSIKGNNLPIPTTRSSAYKKVFVPTDYNEVYKIYDFLKDFYSIFDKEGLLINKEILLYNDISNNYEDDFKKLYSHINDTFISELKNNLNFLLYIYYSSRKPISVFDYALSTVGIYTHNKGSNLYNENEYITRPLWEESNFNFYEDFKSFLYSKNDDDDMSELLTNIIILLYSKITPYTLPDNKNRINYEKYIIKILNTYSIAHSFLKTITIP